MTAPAPAEPSAPHVDGDPVTLQLSGIRTERMVQVMFELRSSTASHVDPIEAALIETMLKDYRAAVAQLRTVTRHTEKRLATVAAIVKEGTRLLTTPITSGKPSKSRRTN